MRTIKLQLVFFIFLLCQQGQTQEWLHDITFGAVCFNDYLIESADNGYIVLLRPCKTNGICKMLLLKTDINGNILWYKMFGNGNLAVIPANVEQTLDQSLIISGATDNFEPGLNFDPIILKLNSCSEIEWCSIIRTPDIYDYAKRVRQTPTGEYIVLTSYSDPSANNRVQLYKLNASGQWVWKHNYHVASPAFQDDGNDVTVLDDGFLISGNCYAPDPGMPPNPGYERPYYIRTDTAGNVLWQCVYGLENGFHGLIGYNTLVGPSGNFYSTGWHSNYCDTPVLVKCMADSTEGYFQDVIPNSCPGSNGSLNFFDDTTFVMRASGKINGVWQVKWIRMDTLGNELYSKSIADNVYIGASTWAVVTHDKKIVGLSKHNNVNYLFKLNAQFEYDSIYTYPYVYDTLCPYPIVSDTINPDCGLLVGAEERVLPAGELRLRVWPNPAYDRLTVEIPRQLEVREQNGGSVTYNHWGRCVLEVYSVPGNLVYEQSIQQSDRVCEISTITWPRGMYCFRLVFRGATSGMALVVIE